MADIVVSRIQHRRGLRSNLPQPLREGELGFCTDTDQLFIGADPAHTSPGLQIYTDVANGILTAQSFLDNQILGINVDATFTSTLLSLFKTNMIAVNPNQNLLQWDGQSPGVVYVGFEPADLTATLAVINTPQAGITGDPYLAPVPSNLGVIDTTGFLPLSSFATAASLSNVLNQLQLTALATTNLNVEITSSAINNNDTLVSTLDEFMLPATGVFTNTGAEYDIFESDSIIIDYSVTMNDGPNQFSQIGKMTIISSVTQASASLIDESDEIRTFAAGPDINFRALFVAPNLVRLQYTHTFAQIVNLKITTKRWLSF